MRRYTFYLSVALLAFGIGSFVVFSCFWKTQNSLPKVELTEDSKIEIVNSSLENKKTKQPEFIKIELKNLPCEDKILRLVWNELSDETASINVDRAEKIKTCSDILQIDEFDEPVDLNSDGRKEIVIRGIENPFSRCGNNCYTYWIFQQINENEYRKIFEAEGYLPVVKNKKTKGYKDIMFEKHGSYAYFSIILYKFNGTEYLPKNCWSESKLYKNKDGDMVEGKEYKVEYYKCEETGWLQKVRNLEKSQ